MSRRDENRGHSFYVSDVSAYGAKLLIGARLWAELQPMPLIVLGFQELQVVFPITDCVAHTLWTRRQANEGYCQRKLLATDERLYGVL